MVLSRGVEGDASATRPHPPRKQNRHYQQGGKMAADRTANRYNPIGSGGGYGSYGGGGNDAGYTNHAAGQSFYNFSTPSFSGENYTSFSGMSNNSGDDTYSQYWGRPVCMFWVTKPGYVQELKKKYAMQSTYYIRIFVDETENTQSY